MDRQFAFAFFCQLVICHSLLSEPNSVKTGKLSITKISPILADAKKPRIIGGEPALIEKYPYVVSIQQNGTFYGHDFEHFCVGNIIGEKWIVTAAKCCYGKKPGQFHVRVGSELYYVGGRIHEIEKIEIHPKYNELTWDYDVGLLKLHETMDFGKNVQPIELPKVGRSIKSSTILEIAGWGATKLLGMPSDRLNHNTILTISQDDCRAFSGNSLTDRMFCVFKKGNGPCIGDTGSPAVLNGVIIGVASWSQSCAYKYPTAYARLPEMVDWITKVTGVSSSKTSNSNTNSIIINHKYVS